MQKLLFVSDPHITIDGETIIGLDPAERLKAILEAAITAHADAEALVLLGDLTHHGAPAEYARLQSVLAGVPIPIIPMMGNHDRRQAFIELFPETPLADGFVQQVRDFGQTRLITLDSLDGPPYRDGHHAGRLCPTRLEFLETALATRGDKYAIVCVHHPPFATGITGMDSIRLAEGSAFLDLLASYGKLHLICGHIHRTMSGSTRGVPWSMFKSPCHQGLLAFDDPNSHLSSNEPGAYGLALLSGDGVVIHSEDVGLTGRQVFGGYAVADHP
ncbi:phosphodiesterase [Yoonia litorea]|uniref:3',5'-cyclic AMP phosphodiesterase CpdA n=1 Tax=Yoonia litorea TaxID=1123755 RepID=A0A1I6MFW8_9RHOB|nr:phosphodiesterase [Yoonia litorea]SFS14600.1 3',5'-cyclic AMP phosphodiesterase CpdA [Yoonia litorea]